MQTNLHTHTHTHTHWTQRHLHTCSRFLGKSHLRNKIEEWKKSRKREEEGGRQAEGEGKDGKVVGRGRGEAERREKGRRAGEKRWKGEKKKNRKIFSRKALAQIAETYSGRLTGAKSSVGTRPFRGEVVDVCREEQTNTVQSQLTSNWPNTVELHCTCTCNWKWN